MNRSRTDPHRHPGQPPGPDADRLGRRRGSRAVGARCQHRDASPPGATNAATCRSPESAATACSCANSSRRCSKAGSTRPCTASRTCRPPRRAGLAIACVPRRATPFDALVGRTAARLGPVPAGAVVGTSSIRRVVQVQRVAQRPRRAPRAGQRRHAAAPARRRGIRRPDPRGRRTRAARSRGP